MLRLQPLCRAGGHSCTGPEQPRTGGRAVSVSGELAKLQPSRWRCLTYLGFAVRSRLRFC